MRRSLPFALLLGAVLGCAADATAPQAPVQASYVTVETENLFETLESDPFTIESACGEDIVASVGTVHLMRHVMILDDGTEIVRVRANLQGVIGYGEITGAEYRLVSNTRIDQQGVAPLPGTTVVIRQKIRGISKGPADNLIGEALTTILFREGQQPLVTVEVDATCRG